MTETTVIRCGFCMDEVDEPDIPDHLCIQGYKHIVINDSGLFFPRTDGDSVSEDIQHLDDSSSQAEVSVSLDIDIEEMLISEVRNRPILWDHRLPITIRGKTATATQWAEISKALNGQLTAVDAAKKWRNLKDCFMRCLNEEKKSKASGAAATKRKKWRWYDHMMFYKETQAVVSTASSLHSPSLDDDSDSEANRQRKRKASNNNTDILLEKITTALQEPIAPPMLPPQIMPQPHANKPMDDIDHVTQIIGNAIRRMPESEKLPFALHLLNVTIEKEVQLKIGQVPHHTF